MVTDTFGVLNHTMCGMLAFMHFLDPSQQMCHVSRNSWVNVLGRELDCMKREAEGCKVAPRDETWESHSKFEGCLLVEFLLGVKAF